jgi:hypothetical protein
MKKHFPAFFIIALLSEVTTTWLQQFGASKQLGEGFYYPDFGSMLLNRLLYWLVIFLLLSALWLLISRSSQES